LNLHNTRIAPDESIRVFPISNWTELDIWQYIHAENIPIAPLHLAAQRPQLRAAGAFDRFGCARVDGKEKAGWVFLSP
jgi:3'-phosphoadenosine 5'-phosphosulfate sulfotransferase (PAPS reductase)/FAD synthetase